MSDSILPTTTLPTTDIGLQPGSGPNGRFPRIILFDVDGTLIKAARRGEYRGLINQKLIELFGTCGRISEVDFAGKTDLAIYREALESEGIGIEAIQRLIPEIEVAMAEVLDSMAADGEVFHLCPGVQELLEALSRDSRFVTSLLTGNMERLAFGSDAEERDHLPAVAAARFKEQLGRELAPDRFVIVGDTPRDISCARHFGARVLAVASGSHTVADLAALTPDALLPDLSNTKEVLEILAFA
jgi:phosphoglycolate phosphatase-like HAD superfamily hydrolase